MILRTAIVLTTVVSCAALAQPPDASFVSGVYAIFEKAGCRACHNMDGVAAGTRLRFPEPDAAPDRIAAFGRSLVNLIDSKQPARSLLLTKPTNQAAHVGGERIQPGSPQAAMLEAWVDRLTKLSGEDLAKALRYREEEERGSGHTAPRVELRRLTHSQYNNTIRDLLGDLSKPADRFPPEDFINGFRNQIQAQSLSPLLIEAYSASAEKLAQNALRGGDTKGLIGCKPSAACRAKFVREFGAKAFRRPLDAAEQKRYETLLSKETDFLKGAQLVMEAMLQSTNFLFRLEDTADTKWKPYATASKLSYALWDSMPDAELFAAAERGDLSNPRGVERTVRRMLDHPRAKQAIDEFVSQWLRFDRILTASKDRRRYPQFTRETAVAMTEEAKLFTADLIWNDRNFMDLFTARYSFINGELASIYKLTPPATEFGRVEFPAESQRAGILGQALFLALTAKPEESSPTARGLFVREQFLCQHVPDPPAGVNTNLPPFDEAKPQTNRDRMAEHATNPSCAGCHALIDPIGYGLEHFDAVGARRDKFTLSFAPRRTRAERNNPPKVVHLDIDANGYLAGIPDSKFTSPAQLGSVLARSAQCQECVAKQYFRYVSGRAETAADRPVIVKMTTDFRNSQFQFKELILSLMLSRAHVEGTVHAVRHHKPR